METRKVNNVDWWSDDARTTKQEDAPAGIVADTPAAEELKATTVPAETVKYPVQSTGAQQVAPVIQPLVIVPYVSKDQPLRYLDKALMGVKGQDEDYDEDYYYEDMYDTKKVSKAAPSGTRNASKDNVAPKGLKKKSGPNGGGIAAFVFGIIYILMLFDWTKISFLSAFTYNHLGDGVTAYSTAETLVKSFIEGTFEFGVRTTLIDILFLAGVVLTVITILVGIFSCASRTPVFFKVIAVIAFVLHLTAYLLPNIIFPLIDKTDMTYVPEYYGLFILIGLCLLVMICTLAGKGKKKIKG